MRLAARLGLGDAEMLCVLALVRTEEVLEDRYCS